MHEFNTYPDITSMHPSTLQSLKCVVVGDATIGKTCLLERNWYGTFHTLTESNGTRPTIIDFYGGNHVIMVDGIRVNLTPWDTAGKDDYDRVRPFFYPATDVFLICFSLAR